MRTLPPIIWKEKIWKPSSRPDRRPSGNTCPTRWTRRICRPDSAIRKQPFKIIEVVSVANLISTILGGIFLFLWNASVSCSAEQLYFFGPLYGIMEYLFPISPLIAMFGLIFFLVLYNVFFCIFSYFIERFIAQKYLQNTYSREVISKGILRANILSYMVFFFLTYVIFYSFGGMLLPFNTSDTFSAEYSDTF